MSAAGKGKARCQLKNSNGEEFTAVFNGVPGKGLTFVLQELRSKDYLGNKEGVLSKSPYHWRINPDENGNLSGEWILRFDEDIKSVIAYYHLTFAITLYDADKKELAKQRVAYSNFGTGLRKTFPDGSKPGAYLQRTDMSVTDDDARHPEQKEDTKSSEETKNLDDAAGEQVEVIDIAPAPEMYVDSVFTEANDEEIAVLEGEQAEIQDPDFGQKEDQENYQKNENEQEKEAHRNESSNDFKCSGGADEFIPQGGGYVKESGISLKMILLLFKIFIVFSILIVVYMIIK